MNKDTKMNREDITRMAQKAGIGQFTVKAWSEELERFFHLAVAAEREACARVAESLGPIDYPITAALYHGNVADAIRARGEK